MNHLSNSPRIRSKVSRLLFLLCKMASRAVLFNSFLSLGFSLFVLLGSADAQLQVGYYAKTCPNAETIIKEEITRAMQAAPSLGGPLLRIFFHDCFVRGCDASILLNLTSKSSPAEKDAPPNQFLRGFGFIDRIKEKLEKACPSTVSCADVIALIARDVVHFDKGPYWAVPTGRRDGRVSIMNEALAMLPAFGANITTLKSQFASNGLNAKDLVVLSGGHTIGNAHCFTFNNRIYNFTGRGDTFDTDPTLDSDYVANLRSKCAPTDNDTLVEMDPGGFKSFDTSYFKLVAKRRGLFQSDAALLDDPETKAHVFRLANASPDVFFRDFAVSMVNMGNVGVLTGSQGEVRKHLAGLATLGCVQAQLKLGFYDQSCPNAEKIVLDYVKKHIPNAPSLAAPLLRMHFHDCFVRGCDASVLLNVTRTDNSSQTEKTATPNLTLRGFGFIDGVKALLEKECPGVVSCADVISLAARDAVVATGGPSWNVPTGRRDGVVSNATEALNDVPAPTSDFANLTTSFANKGLNLTDLVLLSGAHTIGIGHCSSFSSRLYNFTGRGDQDPALDNFYAVKLKKKCPSLNDNVTVVEMDPGSFRTFDLSYYKLLLKRRGLFQSDAALTTNAAAKAYITGLVNGPPEEFFKQFVLAMEKMGRVQVKTGSEGEIRKNCAL
ncbi:hypothetical protein Taro_045050, partial [Colocasia esculenta]|nr:hypothetical protein [Colocasia esculenta]